MTWTYKNSPEYTQAMADLKSLEFSESEAGETDWVSDYALWRYTKLEESWDLLDAKADQLIRYLGGGAGMISVASFFAKYADQGWVILWAIPSFLLALQAIHCAMQSKELKAFPSPPKIKRAYARFKDHGSDKGKSRFFAGDMHVTCEGLIAALAKKAEILQPAYTWALRAIVALILPIGAAVYLTLKP